MFENFSPKTEASLRLSTISNLAYGTPLQITVEEKPKQLNATNPIVRLLSLIIVSILFLIFFIFQNVSIGFLAIAILVKMFGIDFVAISSVFAPIYVYLTFFNRIGLLFVMRRWGMPPDRLRNTFIAIILMLPAMYYLVKLGISIGVTTFGLSAIGTNDVFPVAQYAQALTEPTTIATLAIATAGNLIKSAANRIAVATKK